jgi:hypothetical protein
MLKSGGSANERWGSVERRSGSAPLDSDDD